MLSQLTAILNNFIKYNSITFALIEVLYKFKINFFLNLLKVEDLNLNNLIKVIIIVSLKTFE